MYEYGFFIYNNIHVDINNKACKGFKSSHHIVLLNAPIFLFLLR